MNPMLRQMRRTVCRVSPVAASKIMYRKIMHKRANLLHPQTFNEKIQYLKLYELPKNPLAAICADKYAVREYVQEKGCGTYLNDLIGVWDRAEEIPWDSLPNQFAIKCNHGCTYNIICGDKKSLDIRQTAKKLNRWLKEDFYLNNAELHYKHIPRKIICEKYLGDKILDYKFFCFHGEPRYLYISQGLMHVDLKIGFFHFDGSVAPFHRMDYPALDIPIAMPENVPEMLDVCRRLSSDFKFARIDLFSIEGRIYFSEITLTPAAGMMPLDPPGYDAQLGGLLEIER